MTSSAPGRGRTAGFYRSPARGRALADLARAFSRPDYRVTYAVVKQRFDDDDYQVVIRWWWTGEREQTFAVSGYSSTSDYVRERLFADLFQGGTPQRTGHGRISGD